MGSKSWSPTAGGVRSWYQELGTRIMALSSWLRFSRLLAQRFWVCQRAQRRCSIHVKQSDCQVSSRCPNQSFVRISPLSDCPIQYAVRLSELILVSDSLWNVRMTSEIRLSGWPGVSKQNSQRPIVQMCPILRINTGVRFEFRFEICQRIRLSEQNRPQQSIASREVLWELICTLVYGWRFV